MAIQDGFFGRCIVATGLLFATTSIFAGGTCATPDCTGGKVYKGTPCSTPGTYFDCPQHTPRLIFILSGGYGYSHVGENSQTIVSPAGTSYVYDGDTDVQSQPYGGIGIGAEFVLPGGMLIDIDAAYYITEHYKADGFLTVDGVRPEFPAYNYKIIGRQALIELKILGDMGSAFHPYITLAAGESFNSAYDYETNAVGTPVFSGNLTRNFSYSGAIGVDTDLNSFTRLGIGYRYTNFGDVETDNGRFQGTPGSDTMDPLSMSNFHTQAWLMQLTFLI